MLGAVSVLLERKRLPKEGTAIGTLSFRSLHDYGKVQELTHELKRYRWNILGFAEVRWTGFGKKNYHG